MMRTAYDMSVQEYRTYLGCLAALFLTMYCCMCMIPIIIKLVSEFQLPVSIALWAGQIPQGTVMASCFITAALASRYGKVRIARIGLVSLSFSFIPLMISPNVTGLVVTEYMASIGSALLGATILSMITDVTRDEHRIKVFAMCSAMTGAGAVVGPLIGDLLAEYVGILAVFIAPVPLCALVMFYLRGTNNVVSPSSHRINVKLHLSYIAGMSIVVYALFSMHSDSNLKLLLVGILLILLFALLNHFSDDKAVPPGIIHNKIFMFALVTGFIYNLISYSIVTVGDIALEFIGGSVTVFGMTISLALIGALALSVKNLAQAVLSPPVGAFIQKHPADHCLIGMLLLLVPVVMMIIFLCLAPLKTYPGIVVIAGFLLAVSYVFFTPTNKKQMMCSVTEEERNIASSLVNLTSQSAGIAGCMILSALARDNLTADSVSGIYLEVMVIFLLMLIVTLLLFVIRRAMRD